MEPPNGSDAGVGLRHERVSNRLSKSCGRRDLRGGKFKRLETRLRGKREGELCAAYSRSCLALGPNRARVRAWLSNGRHTALKLAVLFMCISAAVVRSRKFG
jgi:hypothetical protein